MTMLVDIAWRVARMIVVLSGHVFVAVTVLVEIAGLVPRMIVVLAGNLSLAAGVAVAMVVKIARGVSRMVVMRAGLLFRHVRSPMFVAIQHETRRPLVRVRSNPPCLT